MANKDFNRSDIARLAAFIEKLETRLGGAANTTKIAGNPTDGMKEVATDSDGKLPVADIGVELLLKLFIQLFTIQQGNVTRNASWDELEVGSHRRFINLANTINQFQTALESKLAEGFAKFSKQIDDFSTKTGDAIQLLKTLRSEVPGRSQDSAPQEFLKGSLLDKEVSEPARERHAISLTAPPVGPSPLSNGQAIQTGPTSTSNYKADSNRARPEFTSSQTSELINPTDRSTEVSSESSQMLMQSLAKANEQTAELLKLYQQVGGRIDQMDSQIQYMRQRQ